MSYNDSAVMSYNDSAVIKEYYLRYKCSIVVNGKCITYREVMGVHTDEPIPRIFSKLSKARQDYYILDATKHALRKYVIYWVDKNTAQFKNGQITKDIPVAIYNTTIDLALTRETYEERSENY